MQPRFIPARLVKAKDRWYIQYYQTNPMTDELVRKRETHNINRIKDLHFREKEANSIVEKINTRLLPHGYPFTPLTVRQENKFSLPEALHKAMQIHTVDLRPASIKDYNSKINIFLEWWKKSAYKGMQVKHVNKFHMLEYLDEAIIQRGIGARTYNNTRRVLSAIFQRLVDRNYIEINPCTGIKKKRTSDKIRRPISKSEQKIIFEAARNYKSLQLAILMVFALAIRPAEIRRMRRHNIDMENGMIHLPGEITKNKRDSVIVIPGSIKERFSKLIPECHPRMFVIGSMGEPSFTPCGKNWLALTHKNLLRKLKKEGVLEDIEGITLYSWKDTGAFEMSNQVGVVALMHHFRHQDLSATQRYVSKLNPMLSEMKKVHFKLLDIDSAE